MTYPTPAQISAAQMAYLESGGDYDDFWRVALIAADEAAWRPISEAPHDGTHVMLFCESAFGTTIIEGWRSSRIWQTTVITSCCSPTHFRPMLLPPSNKEKNP